MAARNDFWQVCEGSRSLPLGSLTGASNARANPNATFGRHVENEAEEEKIDQEETPRNVGIGPP